MTFGLWGRPQLGELQTEGHRCGAGPRLSAELGNPGPLDRLPSCPPGNPPHPHTNFGCAWKFFILPSLLPKPVTTAFLTQGPCQLPSDNFSSSNQHPQP